MVEPTVIGFYGASKTGKTTLIVTIIQRLVKQVYTIASIKKTDKKIGMDMKGKDTWKHSAAGSSLVVLSSPYETDFVIKQGMKTEEIVRIISELGRYDLILVEGANDPGIPKIRIGECKERSNTICSYQNDIDEILKIIQKELKKKTSTNALQITVNGNNIPLTKFPAEIITNAIVGMLHSLKGVQTIKDVTIRLKL